MKVKYLLLMSVMWLISCVFRNDNYKRPDSLIQEGDSKFYSFKMKTLSGEEVDFSSFKGKKVLIVNTASKCGYTPQYEELQKLHKQYGDKVTVLGFPCNQFMGQEPGSSEEIKNFCKVNYGVEFTMFEKIDVKGSGKHPLYKWLTEKSQNGWNDKEPTWNFCKYLIDEKGNLMYYWGSGVNPMSDQVLNAIAEKR